MHPSLQPFNSTFHSTFTSTIQFNLSFNLHFNLSFNLYFNHSIQPSLHLFKGIVDTKDVTFDELKCNLMITPHKDHMKLSLTNSLIKMSGILKSSCTFNYIFTNHTSQVGTVNFTAQGNVSVIAELHLKNLGVTMKNEKLTHSKVDIRLKNASSGPFIPAALNAIVNYTHTL